MSRLPSSLQDVDSGIVSLDEDSYIKVLGMIWQPVNDVFSYRVQRLHDRVTKRVILSEIARIFDPIGFLSPVIVSAKILIQELWLAGIGWDVEVSQDLKSKWLRIVSEFSDLRKFQLLVSFPTSLSKVELHDFCDSSETAYAAVIYLRVVDSDENVSVHIFAAKSRVAPLKRLSLPR